jgi:hypothetical protein
MGIRNRVVGVSSIDLIAREFGVWAQILSAGQAMAALSASPAQPGDANAVADPEAIHAWTQRIYPADDFMAQN